jgi:aspartate aminotransferase, mitochondrial
MHLSFFSFSVLSAFPSVALALSLATPAPSVLANSMSFLDTIPQGAPDAILGIAQAFGACPSPNKVNVCVGAYRDENGIPWVLPSVKEAEERLLGTNKEYLPIEGDSVFIEKALQFAFGADMDLTKLAGVQSLSGTGACRVGGAFLGRFFGDREIYIPNPTWGNHMSIFKDAGLNYQRYRYYSRKTNGLDFDGLMEDITAAKDGSIILLHACAHNPTGCDPTHDQWKNIAALCKSKRHICFFDSAYQGFASGDSELDAFALRYFCSQDIPVMLAQSFAKNFGLYGERCGTFSIVCRDATQRDLVMSQLKLVVRPMYSSPPKHGAAIVKTVLCDEILTAQYYEECKLMASRIQKMRTALVETLGKVGSTHDWSHVASQIGMFAYTGMDQDMCDALTNDYAIYLTRDGRISIAGLNDGNVEYVAKAIHAVTDGKSITEE